MRDQNPKVWDKTGKKSRKGNPIKHEKKHRSPRVANRKKFMRRIVLDKQGNKQT